MRFYIHPINPHFAATHADDYFKGWQYGIWEHPYPAAEPSLYQIQSQHLEAAQVAKTQADLAMSHLPDELVKGEWLKLPKGVEPHSFAAATLMGLAAAGSRPFLWPWTECSAHA